MGIQNIQKNQRKQNMNPTHYTNKHTPRARTHTAQSKACVICVVEAWLVVLAWPFWEIRSDRHEHSCRHPHQRGWVTQRSLNPKAFPRHRNRTGQNCSHVCGVKTKRATWLAGCLLCPCLESADPQHCLHPCPLRLRAITKQCTLALPYPSSPMVHHQVLSENIVGD